MTFEIILLAAFVVWGLWSIDKSIEKARDKLDEISRELTDVSKELAHISRNLD
jgi:hypothetical protein